MAIDLSILIPARNEMFLSRTIDDLLENIEGNTEIIAVLDGAWPEIPIKDDKRVTLVYLHESIGQRAATNLACRLSTAKYVMKVDAHCAFDKGFDVKLLKDMRDNWTVAPLMKNLHAFDWVCDKCGNTRYQGRTPESCPYCSNTTDFHRNIVWRAKDSPKSASFRFDRTLHFQYFNEFSKRPEGKPMIAESMSLQGSCFLLTRKKYWELNICDEAFGSWGQQGVEVACKTWLSGGRVMVNKNTWYAHMFRTQGGDFGFPYDISGSQIDHARKLSRELFQNNTWPQQIKPLSWLINKFAPVPDWHETKKLTKGVIYYTDSQLDERIASQCRKQITKGIKEKHIVSVSLKPLQFGTNITLPLERGYLTMAKQILAGLEASTADVVFFCEHDVMYHPSHFDFLPLNKETYYYNTNVWRVRADDGHALYTDDLKQLSGLCAYRETLIRHYKKRIELLEEKETDLDFDFFNDRYTNREQTKEALNKYVRQMGFEPGTHNRAERVDDLKAESYQSAYPNLDIRHSTNLTPSRWKKEQFRNERFTKGWKESDSVPGWDLVKELKTLI